jgi:hypothetical protein
MHKAGRDPLATNPKAPVAEMCCVSEKNKWKKKNKELWLAWMWDRTGAKEKSGQLLGSKDEAHDSRNKSRVPEKNKWKKKNKELWQRKNRGSCWDRRTRHTPAGTNHERNPMSGNRRLLQRQMKLSSGVRLMLN